ncbi:methyl-accepting chemotaxis protein [Bacillus sp. HMF5848]|nr:methyl-accepting chemotaxis protein [Bacillus sp. HMF5848]RSK28411.1 methyl-accepting chemotaxis protein [Bacillus sp. HMF5848]
MNWVKNRSFFGKLIILIVGSVIALAAVSLTGFLYMNQMSGKASEMYNDRLLPVAWLNEARAISRNNESLMLEIITTKDAQLVKQYEEELSSKAVDFDALLKKYRDTYLKEFEVTKLGELDSALEGYRIERGKTFELIQGGNLEGAYSYFKSNMQPQLDKVNGLLDELVTFNAEEAGKLNTGIETGMRDATIIMIVVTLVAAGIAIGFGLMLSRLMTKPVQEISAMMAKAEQGDFTVESTYESKDELGQLALSFNSMVSGLRILIQEVRQNADNLAASSEEISASTEEIAGGSQQQAQSASDTTEMVKDMTKAIQEVSRNAEDASSFSQKTESAASNGSMVMQETLEGMSNIKQQITELASKSEQIGEIVEVIDEIAEQTNLLALNAAIEAARAGEAGKGFAVVADEVRKLAERSSKATKEISELIHSIQQNTESSVTAVNNGNERANSAGVTFKEIVKLVKESATKVSSIAAASEEQAAQSEEVLTSVENIAAITEETAASVEETAATANDLARMAEVLNSLTSRFKV